MGCDLNRYWLVLILMYLGCSSAWCQGMELRLISDEALPKGIKAIYDYRSNNKTGQLKTEIIHELYKKGYLEAGIDECDTLADGMQCKLHIGANYQWALLRIGNLGKEVASASGFRERVFRNSPLSPFELGSLMEDILQHYENNGYPFASVELDSLLFENDGVNAALKVTRNALVRIDSVVIKGSMKTAPVVIYEQIGINPGDLYDESRLETIPKRLKELAFVRSRAAPYVLFSKEETKLYLFLDDKKASSVTGILGVLPNDVTGKITFTGDLDLHLISALRRGETIRLEWRRLQDQTQDLKAGFNYPFLFNSPFGLDASLTIYRRDTSFLDVGTLLGASIRLDLGDKLTGFIRRNSSNRLGKRDTFIPGLADTKTTSYGVTIERDRTDYRRNPRRGHRLTLTGAAGKKTSERLSANDEEEILEDRTAQYDVQGKVGTFIAVGKRGTIYSGVQGGSMINDVLYNNELFRIGGFKDQRGVDDVSITASSYAVATLEYRLLLEENSNLFLFIDQGWWENQAEEIPTRDTPLAFGVGTNFETTAGIFSLSYALGKQFDNPFQFNNAKVHFGFASLF